MEPLEEKVKPAVQSAFEHAGEHVNETMHQASRVASAAADTVGDGIDAARRAAKRGGYAAAEMYYDAKRQVQRNPIETVVASFGAGLAAATVLGWIMRQRRHCCRAEKRDEVR